MLAVTGATVSFGRVRALDGIDLEVATGEVVAILGPSGCGKSTLLRAVAGLQPLDSGEVHWDGEDLAGLPVHRRDFGLMFQEHALFSHRDVAANVAFGLRMQKMDAAGRSRRVREVLGLVGLAGYQERTIATLSGGEAQRVALARSLAPRAAAADAGRAARLAGPAPPRGAHRGAQGVAAPDRCHRAARHPRPRRGLRGGRPGGGHAVRPDRQDRHSRRDLARSPPPGRGPVPRSCQRGGRWGRAEPCRGVA